MARPRYKWNEKAGRYVDSRGRFVSVQQVDFARERMQGAGDKQAEYLAGQLRSGKITVQQWESQMRTLVKDTHLANAMLAHGGPDNMTKGDYGVAGPLIRDDFKRLNQFAQDIESGKVPLDGRFVARARMYPRHGRTTYNLSRRRLMKKNGLKWERNIMGPADHCSECIDQSAQGWVPIGTLVPIGNRQCLSNCACTITYGSDKVAMGFSLGGDEPDDYGPGQIDIGGFAPGGGGTGTVTDVFQRAMQISAQVSVLYSGVLTARALAPAVLGMVDNVAKSAFVANTLRRIHRVESGLQSEMASMVEVPDGMAGRAAPRMRRLDELQAELEQIQKDLQDRGINPVPTRGDRYRPLPDESVAWLEKVKRGADLEDINLTDFERGWETNYWMRWAEKLDPDQMEALSEYQGSGHQRLNEWLRGSTTMRRWDSAAGKGIEAPLDESTLRWYRFLRDNLDRSMVEIPEDIVVFRGVQARLVEGMKLGDEFVDNAFVSTTMSAHRSGIEGRMRGAMLEIRVPQGTKGAIVELAGGSRREFELLLERGRTYRIVEDAGTKGGVRRLVVEIVDADAATDIPVATRGRGVAREVDPADFHRVLSHEWERLASLTADELDALLPWGHKEPFFTDAQTNYSIINHIASGGTWRSLADMPGLRDLFEGEYIDFVGVLHQTLLSSGKLPDPDDMYHAWLMMKEIQVKRHIAPRMDRAIMKQRAPEDLWVYKGMDKAPEWTEGTIFTDRGFNSTSLSPENAFPYVGGEGNDMAMVRILLPKGTPAMAVDTWSVGYRHVQNEVLLPRGTAYRVVEVTTQQAPHPILLNETVRVRMITMEVVPAEDAARMGLRPDDLSSPVKIRKEEYFPLRREGKADYAWDRNSLSEVLDLEDEVEFRWYDPQGTKVGYVRLMRFQPTMHGYEGWRVKMIETESGYRRGGIATEMYDDLARMADEAGTIVWTSTDELTSMGEELAVWRTRTGRLGDKIEFEWEEYGDWMNMWMQKIQLPANQGYISRWPTLEQVENAWVPGMSKVTPVTIDGQDWYLKTAFRTGGGVQAEEMAYKIGDILGVGHRVVPQKRYVSSTGSEFTLSPRMVGATNLGEETSHLVPPSRLQANKGDVDRLNLFEFIVQSDDRHSGNYMIGPRGVVALDYEDAFRSSTPLDWSPGGANPNALRQAMDLEHAPFDPEEALAALRKRNEVLNYLAKEGMGEDALNNVRLRFLHLAKKLDDHRTSGRAILFEDVPEFRYGNFWHQHGITDQKLRAMSMPDEVTDWDSAKAWMDNVVEPNRRVGVTDLPGTSGMSVDWMSIRYVEEGDVRWARMNVRQGANTVSEIETTAPAEYFGTSKVPKDIHLTQITIVRFVDNSAWNIKALDTFEQQVRTGNYGEAREILLQRPSVVAHSTFEELLLAGRLERITDDLYLLGPAPKSTGLDITETWARLYDDTGMFRAQFSSANADTFFRDQNIRMPKGMTGDDLIIYHIDDRGIGLSSLDALNELAQVHGSAVWVFTDDALGLSVQRAGRVMKTVEDANEAEYYRVRPVSPLEMTVTRVLKDDAAAARPTIKLERSDNWAIVRRGDDDMAQFAAETADPYWSNLGRERPGAMGPTDLIVYHAEDIWGFKNEIEALDAIASEMRGGIWVFAEEPLGKALVKADRVLMTVKGSDGVEYHLLRRIRDDKPTATRGEPPREFFERTTPQQWEETTDMWRRPADYTYAEDRAIQGWGGKDGDYAIINAHLRGQEIPDVWLDEWYQEWGVFSRATQRDYGNVDNFIQQKKLAAIARIEPLKEAIDKSASPGDLVVWRGMQHLDEQISEGFEFVEPSFMATSLNKAQAMNYDVETHLFRIQIREGQKALMMDATDVYLTAGRQHEVLLPPNTRFRVVSIEEGGPLVPGLTELRGYPTGITGPKVVTLEIVEDVPAFLPRNPDRFPLSIKKVDRDQLRIDNYDEGFEFFDLDGTKVGEVMLNHSIDNAGRKYWVVGWIETFAPSEGIGSGMYDELARWGRSRGEKVYTVPENLTKDGEKLLLHRQMTGRVGQPEFINGAFHREVLPPRPLSVMEQKLVEKDIIPNMADNFDTRRLQQMFEDERWQMVVGDNYGQWGRTRVDIEIYPRTTDSVIQVRPDADAPAWHPRLTFVDTKVARMEGDRIIPQKGWTTEVPAEFVEDGYMYRGVSYEEWQEIQRTGRIQSRGEYNLGGEQEGMTFFSLDPSQAAHYAGTFQPYQTLPTFNKPAYVVRIKIQPDAITSEMNPAVVGREVAMRRAVSIDEIDMVLEVRPGSITPGRVELTDDILGNGMGQLTTGGRSSPGMQVFHRVMEVDAPTATRGRRYREIVDQAEQEKILSRWDGKPKASTIENVELPNGVFTNEVSDNDILARYVVGDTFFKINNQLRKRAAGTLSDHRHAVNMQRDVDIEIGHLERIVRNHEVPEDLVVYRGIESGEARLFLDGARVGDEWIEPAFMSTTLKKNVAEEWPFQWNIRDKHTTGESAILEVRVPKGTRGVSVDYALGDVLWNQSEILLPPGLRLRLVETYLEPDGLRRVVVEVVEDTRQGPIPLATRGETFREFKHKDVEAYMRQHKRPQSEWVSFYEETSDEIQEALRTGRLSAFDREMVAGIDARIAEQTLPENMIVYRGINSPELTKQLLASLPGDMLPPNPGYMSTTPSEALASYFMEHMERGMEGGIMMKIRARKGQNVAFLADVEYEMLFPRNTQLRLVSVDGVDKGILKVTVEIVEDAPTATRGDLPANPSGIRSAAVRIYDDKGNSRFYEGFDHADARIQMEEILEGPENDWPKAWKRRSVMDLFEEDGFVTTDGRFVSREEGLEIAIAARQAPSDVGSGNYTLLAEDVIGAPIIRREVPEGFPAGSVRIVLRDADEGDLGQVVYRKVGDKVEIHWIEVVPEWRRQNIGQQLLGDVAEDTGISSKNFIARTPSDEANRFITPGGDIPTATRGSEYLRGNAVRIDGEIATGRTPTEALENWVAQNRLTDAERRVYKREVPADAATVRQVERRVWRVADTMKEWAEVGYSTTRRPFVTRAEAQAVSAVTKQDLDAPISVPYRVLDSESTAHYSGQTNFRTYATLPDGEIVGQIDYVLYNGEITVSMIEVPVEFRRLKIATSLYEKILEEHPTATLGRVMTTGDGAELRRTINVKYADRITVDKRLGEVTERVDPNTRGGRIIEMFNRSGEKMGTLHYHMEYTGGKNIAHLDMILVVDAYQGSDLSMFMYDKLAETVDPSNWRALIQTPAGKRAREKWLKARHYTDEMGDPLFTIGDDIDAFRQTMFPKLDDLLDVRVDITLRDQIVTDLYYGRPVPKVIADAFPELQPTRITPTPPPGAKVVTIEELSSRRARQVALINAARRHIERGDRARARTARERLQKVEREMANMWAPEPGYQGLTLKQDVPDPIPGPPRKKSALSDPYQIPADATPDPSYVSRLPAQARIDAELDEIQKAIDILETRQLHPNIPLNVAYAELSVLNSYRIMRAQIQNRAGAAWDVLLGEVPLPRGTLATTEARSIAQAKKNYADVHVELVIGQGQAVSKDLMPIVNMAYRAMAILHRQGISLPRGFRFMGMNQVPLDMADSWGYFMNTDRVISFMLDSDLLSDGMRSLRRLAAHAGPQGTRLHATGDPIGVFFHELGHAAHHERIGSSAWARWGGRNREKLTIDEQAIAMRVARYPGDHILEFVAEVFTGLISGVRYDPQVMALYRKYSGPRIPNVPGT